MAKNLGVTMDFYEKRYLPVITWNKTHFSKQVVPITCTLGKMFFEAAALDGLWSISIQTELKTGSIL